jgi:hypothetical protein
MNAVLDLGISVKSLVCVPIVAVRSSGSSSSSSGAGPSPVRQRPIAILRVINKVGGGVFTQNDERLLGVIGQQIGECLSRFQAEQALDEDDSRTTPIWQVPKFFHFRVVSVDGIVVPKKATGLLGGGPDRFHVIAQVYHGLVPVCAPVVAPKASVDARSVAGESQVRYSATFHSLLFPAIAYHDLPRAARVIFTVYCGKVAVAWTGCNCTQYDGQVRHGPQKLYLWPGACPTPIVTALDNHHVDSRVGVLEVVFGEQLPKPVLFTNHGEMPPNDMAAAVQAAYGILTPDLEVRPLFCCLWCVCPHRVVFVCQLHPCVWFSSAF